MGRMALYDSIARYYAEYRQPDQRIASAIDAALGDAISVVNIGAGAGSYEPLSRAVIAVEPSELMIRQRPKAGSVAFCSFTRLRRLSRSHRLKQSQT